MNTQVTLEVLQFELNQEELRKQNAEFNCAAYREALADKTALYTMLGQEECERLLNLHTVKWLAHWERAKKLAFMIAVL